ncbi:MULTISPECIES: GDP-mannose 4,6-dehydratase [Pseudoalteromonas]|uniref:NAD-dependent epimerase/dehydratase family protein n=1 Tax=Pseudoalteromonas piscicida TaxID=43662 RepID=A0AAD0RHM3_PSEO7|nr:MULTISPECIES: GDP-mannose 4,6-dehydratase [Pseudoalteromonas]ASD67484.1 dTDP-glucose 4,6-dehydratase [Pseudoalteromonas piscicida]AXR01814.1 NAD-dependent epimerase/dehydratase family protein [Pseudoalteromonas piscicida]MCO7190034.1 GDP-mannose 4,6-dehydratase [Pseudoalteromonas sp. XMcav2-N]
MIESPVLVLGSNSFSGASFCSYLLKQEKQVIAVSRSNEPNPVLLPYKWLSLDHQINFHQLDLNHHLAEIMALIEKYKIRHIYNFAAQSMVGQSWQYPEHWFMTNAVSTIKLHNLLRQYDGLERYVHVSTPEVYGSCSGLVTESRHYQPSTPYAVSRAAADLSLHTFNDVYDFPVVFTRAANVFGEGQQLYRIIPKTIMCALNNEILPLHGGGHSTRSFIHMDDVSSATHSIGENGQNGDIYHISTTRNISVRELVMKICEMLGKPFEQVCQVSEDRLGKDAAYLLDSQKLKSELGWQDTITLENGLERTISWVKDNLDTLNTLPKDYVHKP